MPTADRYENDRHPGVFMGELSLTDDVTAAAVHRIGLRAYTVEAELIRFDRIPPLRESLEEMRAQPLRWLGATVEGEIAAFVAWEALAEDLIGIARVCVDPQWFRRGLALALLRHLLADLAPEHDALVSTGADNYPAVALYERLGFCHVDTIEPAPGVRLARFKLARPSGRPGR
ncbi:GNAT family N-acetyltransferase [Streptomyces roseus]|uniref:GNAT family N-acetyltransferase n=1 Tax=Streptomyces roseus TaxID=66430 RepID=UPI0033DC10D0